DDAMLVDFLATLDDYIPAIPEELVEYYLAAGGFQAHDSRLTRLVAVATQKFVSEVASDALQHSKVRSKSAAAAPSSGGSAKDPKHGGRIVLTSDDLAAALREFGVNVKRQEYYADSAVAG
ncbi:hypothetical protein SELMODRAFT_59588, partial [Selaginella moellendorffii]